MTSPQIGFGKLSHKENLQNHILEHKVLLYASSVASENKENKE